MATSDSWLDRSWPAPADPDAAQRLVERFSALGDGEAALAAQPSGRAMLAAGDDVGRLLPGLRPFARRSPCLSRGGSR